MAVCLNAPPLFERIPDKLFRPLAAPNNQRYWALICALIQGLWGQGGHAPGEDLPRSDAVRFIENEIVADDPWDGTVGTPITIRANMIVDSLVETGWLAARRRGVRPVLTVRPAVARFHGLLVDFSDSQPEFVGAKVRSIFRAVQDAAGGALDAYAEAARQAKACIAHIASTGCRIQDVMDELVAAGSAREFIKGFFVDYIEKVFIADYHELLTRNHPLEFRASIVAQTLELRNDPVRREALLGWYAAKRTAGNTVRAEVMYERDTEQLLDLREIENHLTRLDREISLANQRALAYIRYKTNTPRQFDRLIEKALQAIEQLPDDHIALPPRGCVRHASPAGLPDAKTRRAPPKATALTKRVPTLEEIALHNLRRAMVTNRQVSPADLARYVAAHGGSSREITSDEFTIATVKDLCCYQRLLLIASRSRCPPAQRAHDPYITMVPSLRVTFMDGRQTNNGYMQHQQFSAELTRDTA